MRHFRRIVISYAVFVAALIVLTLALNAQHTEGAAAAVQKPSAETRSGVEKDMKDGDIGDIEDGGMKNGDMKEMGQANSAMSSHLHGHDDMGPHMKMTTLRPLRGDDLARAQSIVDSARASLVRYQDVEAAKADGFRQFLPGVRQKMYHFTNWRYGMEAAFHFNPEHPTSLLYEQQPDHSFKLIGAMYTASKRSSEEDLDKRVPLSIAQWHAHVNLCVPPKQQRDEMFGKDPRFGLQGSITTQQECEAAGGAFKPQIFGWMLHLYPYERTMDDIWSVARQKNTVIPSDANHATPPMPDHR